MRVGRIYLTLVVAMLAPAGLHGQSMGAPVQAAATGAKAPDAPGDRSDRDAAKAFRVAADTDRFTGIIHETTAFAKFVRSDDRRLSCETSNEPTASFMLALQRGIRPPRDTSLAVLVYMFGSDWMFLGEAALKVRVADSVLTLAVEPGSTHEVDPHGGVTEAAAYELTPGTLSALANADSSVIRIEGQKGHCDYRVPEVQMRVIRLFSGVRSTDGRPEP